MFASPWKDGLIVLIIVLLFFGPKRLPALSRSIGESIKEFKGGIAHSSEPESSELPAGAPTTSAGAAAASEARDGSAASEPTNV